MAESAFILPSEPSPLTKFHCFNNLPLEIRQYIWYLCLPGPRIHRIGWRDRQESSRSSYTNPRIHRIGWRDGQKSSRSSCISPTIMFVCQESRREALHHLKRLSLPSTFKAGTRSTPPGCTSRCYFNPAIDTLFITSPSHPTMPLSPWLRPWLKGLDNTDFSLVQHIAVDRAWVWPVPPVSGSAMELGELVRLLGHVKVVHVVSLDSHWSMIPWEMWREIGSTPENERAEYFWVDMEEVKKRPRGGFACFWGEWGEHSRMARAGTDLLSLDSEDAIARLGDVVQRLEAEREKYPTGWTKPRVQLDFVRYGRVQKEEKRAPEKKKGLSSISNLGVMLVGLPSVNSFKNWVGRR